jgi:hypothetical protein
VPVFVVLLGCSGNVPPPSSFALAEPKLDFQALAFRLVSVADVCRRFVAYALVSLACVGFRMF